MIHTLDVIILIIACTHAYIQLKFCLFDGDTHGLHVVECKWHTNLFIKEYSLPYWNYSVDYLNILESYQC